MQFPFPLSLSQSKFHPKACNNNSAQTSLLSVSTSATQPNTFPQNAIPILRGISENNIVSPCYKYGVKVSQWEEISQAREGIENPQFQSVNDKTCSV